MIRGGYEGVLRLFRLVPVNPTHTTENNPNFKKISEIKNPNIEKTQIPKIHQTPSNNNHIPTHPQIS